MHTPTRPPAVEIMRHLGFAPDPWQLDVLEGGYSQLLLNCCRQAGKSTVVALLGLSEAIFVPGTKVLLISRSHRQSQELLRIVTDVFRRLGSPMKERQTADELELSNQSRIVCLPCKEETIRGYSNVRLLVIDEAARVPDDLYRAVRPMLAVSNGRLICLSTPYGRRGFFHDAWARGGSDWTRIEVPASRISRIRPDFLAQERRSLGEAWFRQEYECSFESVEGLVFPDFGRCVTAAPAPAGGQRVGGIDFGFRNPFAAVWGTLDRDGVLWLTGEHYARGRPITFHAQHLPHDVTWYCDPSGANERCELRRADFTIRQGDNAIRAGLAAIAARLENDALRVVQDCCPNLLAEAGLYRYGEDDENPIDEHNHAMSALRYLVSRLPSPVPPKPEATAATPRAVGPRRPDDERYWVGVGQ